MGNYLQQKEKHEAKQAWVQDSQSILIKKRSVNAAILMLDRVFKD